MLSEQEVNARLTALFIDVLRVPAARVTPTARLFDDLGAESLDLLDIRFRIEQEFGFQTTDEEFMKALGVVESAEQFRALITPEHIQAYVMYRISTPDPVQ